MSAENLHAGQLRHSLRTPLNHIIGYGEMILEDLEDEGRAARLRAFLGSARGLVKFIQDDFTPTGERATAEEVRAFQSLLLPRAGKLAAAVDELLADAPESCLGDLAKIRAATGRLLAFAQDRPDAVAGLSSSGGIAERVSPAGAAGRLLIIDDSAANRDILRRHLERQGYGVTAAVDGQHGLALLDADTFDLVLLDVMMPVMDGFEVLKRMKEKPGLREIPVVVISALDESAGVVRCIQMGAEDYLMKPFDSVLLSARIGASLEKKRLRDEERRRAEELQSALDRLRRTQDQLLVQENLASLGALTAGIAHEIKNPLNFVTNFASASREVVKEMRELVAGNENGELSALFHQLEQYVEKIEEHGKRADRIVRGMLMHSRGKSEEPENVDLKSLLGDCVNLAYHALRGQDREFNVRIDTDVDAATGCVRAVPQEIRRVFLNIVNNAFYAVWDRRKKDGPDFHPAVEVIARGSAAGVEVRVRDNGCGIPPDVLPRIFNPFFTTKPAGAGTGLGLSLSHDIIVRGHHGTIRAESEPGAGTVFIVTLPRDASIRVTA